MTKDELQAVAREAVERLREKEGVHARFPFDKLREYVPPDARNSVAASSFQHTWRYLLKEDYLELTGDYTSAVAPERAGSPTREYRLGPRFRDGERDEIVRDSGGGAAASVSNLLKALAAAMEARGFVVTEPELANFYLALKTSPLVILSGVSGTGKSQLPRLFAELTGSRFQLVSVQPQWADNADLLGYTSSLLGGAFIEGEVLQSIRAAHAEGGLSIVLLDEMNLAAVEHYFSDFLSVVETRRREGGEIVTDALPLDLPSPPPEGEDPHADLRSTRLPPNLKVVGTANMDETTRMFSPKVLDRAFSIEFDDVDLTTFATRSEEPGVDFSPLAERLLDTGVTFVSEAYGRAEALFDRAAVLLEEIKEALKVGNVTFGYRTRDQVVMYLYHWQDDGLGEVLDLNAAFDLCVLQKVLPKVSGTGTALGHALDDLVEWLESPRPEAVEGVGLTGPFLRSAAKAKRLRQRLETEGAVSFWEA